VADCHDPDFKDSRLWLVPTDGGTPTALTEPNSGQDGEVMGRYEAPITDATQTNDTRSCAISNGCPTVPSTT
jgi:hypothetical protein